MRYTGPGRRCPVTLPTTFRSLSLRRFLARPSNKQRNKPGCKRPGDPGVESQYITVAVTADGAYYVDQNRVERPQLLSAVRQAAGNRTALVLRADRNATVGQFASVASVAQALNLRVLMATERQTAPLR